MRRSRLFLALGVVWSAALLAAACGGDDSTGDNGSTDAGGTPDATSGDDAGGGTDSGGGDSGQTATANASDLSLYLGQTAQLDGSGSTPSSATFAWTVKSVPVGSAITTAGLTGASTAKPGFTPDKLGDYVLTLTVSSGSASNAKDVTVHALDAPVFYNQLEFNPDAAPPVYKVMAVGASGAGAHSVSCSVGPVDTNGPTPDSFLLSTYTSADWWEAPAGGDSRVAYLAAMQESDGGSTFDLIASTAKTTCAQQPKILATGSFNATLVAMVRLSPDASRVAYLQSDGTQVKVETVAFDGTAPHHVTPFGFYPDGGVGADGGVASVNQLGALRWIANDRLAWGGTIPTTSRFQIVSASDVDNAPARVELGCTGVMTGFDVLPNGDYLVSGQLPLADGGAPVGSDLLVLHPNATTKECELVRNLTQVTSPGSTAGAFSLSPDKAQVAYVLNDPAVDAGGAPSNNALYVAKVDGSSAPARVPGIPFGAGYEPYDDDGPLTPRWVAGGTALSFQVGQESIGAGDGGALPAVVVVPVAGGTVTAVAVTHANEGVYVSSISGCSIAYGPGSAAVALVTLGAFLGLVVRRRRRG